jgi:adenylate cyclase
MVVGGLPAQRPDHARAIARMALAMAHTVSKFVADDGEPFQLRIGINTGPVIAGVIGKKKFSYDLWGDAVNVASRMESSGEPGRIQVSEASYRLLARDFLLEERGLVAIKGKGAMKTYWLIGESTPR